MASHEGWRGDLIVLVCLGAVFQRVVAHRKSAYFVVFGPNFNRLCKMKCRNCHGPYPLMRWPRGRTSATSTSAVLIPQGARTSTTPSMSNGTNSLSLSLFCQRVLSYLACAHVLRLSASSWWGESHMFPPPCCIRSGGGLGLNVGGGNLVVLCG